MTTRRATCSCGQLAVTTEGDPVRLSMCHCLECQRRTGSVFGVQARFANEHIRIEGESTAFARTGDAGGRVTTHFCPRCGSTVHWTIDSMPGVTAVAVGAFADPGFAAPVIPIYGTRKHAWVVPPPGAEQMD